VPQVREPACVAIDRHTRNEPKTRWAWLALRELGAGLVLVLGGFITFAGLVTIMAFGPLAGMSDQSPDVGGIVWGVIAAIAGIALLVWRLRASKPISSSDTSTAASRAGLRMLIAFGCFLAFLGGVLTQSEATKSGGPPGNPIPPLLTAIAGIGIAALGIWARLHHTEGSVSSR
jgi:hypothetical protein